VNEKRPIGKSAGWDRYGGVFLAPCSRYARVMAKVLPRVITTAEEHERTLGEVEKLMDEGEERTILCPIRVLTKCWCI